MKKIALYLIFYFFSISIFQAQNLDSLRTIIKTTKNKEQRVKTLVALGKKELYTNTNEAEKNFRIALKEVTIIKNKKWESDILNQLGVIFYKKSQFDSALVFYKKSFEISKQLKDTLQLAINYSNVANILRAQDKHDLAIKNFLKALPIYEKKGEILYQAMTFGAIGTLHLSLGEYAKALPYFEKTNKILYKINNKQGIVTTELNIAICLEKLDKKEEAKALLKKVIKSCKTNNYQRNHSIALTKLGKIYLSENDNQNAKKHFKTALKEFKVLNDIGGLAETHLLLADINFKNEAYKLALNNYKSSLLFSEKIGKNKKNPTALKGIINSLKKLNRKKETIIYYDLLLKAKDTVFNIERRKITDEITTKFNVSQKEKEIEIKQLEIDKKDTQLIKQKQFGFALTALTILLLGLLYFVKKANKFKRLNEYNIIKKNKLELEQKVLINQMNPHFIFNALNSIQSYVSENNVTNAEIYLAKFSRLIRLILENSRKEFVPFIEDYFALDAYIKLEQLRFDHSFDYQINYPKEFDEINIPPMLVQPFVENAIKHGISSIKEKGNITISFQVLNAIDENDFGTILCIITDNGIGLTMASKKEKTNFKQHKSMSFKLIENRLSNYTKETKKDYHFTIKPNNNQKGTTVTLEIPYTI